MDTTIDTGYGQDRTTALSVSKGRAAGFAAIGGAILMFGGAALYFSSGTDLWAAVDGGDMAGYLTAVGQAKAQLVANLTLWILGVLLLTTAIHGMADLDGRRSVAARVAAQCAQIAAPMAIISFIAMLSLVVQIAPDTSEVSVVVAQVVGWFGARADDLATALLVGFAPLFLALSARKAWAPGWLAAWAYLAALVGLISIAGIYLPALSDVGFLIVPVGLGWMIAAGIVLVRRNR